MASYNVIFWRPDTPNRTYSMVCDGETYRETLAYFGLVWVAIPTSGPQPVRHAPRKPKRFGGLIEGAMISPAHPDRYHDVCRSIDSVDSATPPLRRNDLVALQSGGLLPHEILAKAKQ